MSLVGSLEDLGLADVLQIASLSRKSGILRLRSDGGDGSIALRDGAICAASIKGEPESLAAILEASGAVSTSVIDAARATSLATGASFREVLVSPDQLGAERFETLLREHVETTVLRMFAWLRGEFSLELGAALDAPAAELCLSQGLSAQYVAMEASRSEGDGLAAAYGAEPEADAPWFSGEGADTPAPPCADAPGAVSVGESTNPHASGGERAIEALPTSAPLVILDSELLVLEWAKETLSRHFSRVHIFQGSEPAIERVRSYLGRGEVPVVLLSAHASGSASAAQPLQLIQRLRALAARMPVVLCCDEASVPALRESPLAAMASALAARPSSTALARSFAHPIVAARLIETLAPWSRRAAAPREPAARVAQPAVSLVMQQLREASQRLRSLTAPSEILSLVVDCAAQHLPRVALFAVRDGTAWGIAARGLERCGGPTDARLRRIATPVSESAWFQRALDSRRPSVAPPQGEGDLALARQLGTELPDHAYVAPIEVGDEVVALLYGDSLPEGGPARDLSALEVLLHIACIGLDRARLTRALHSSSAPARR
jgi:hypothetical protein